MHILNRVQVNLIYNTNRDLFLRIEIFISTTDLYNTTVDRWSFVSCDSRHYTMKACAYSCQHRL